jgi:hypothetical protein
MLTKTAAILTIVMSVLNLPTAFTSDDISTAFAWGISLLGVLGLIVAIAALKGARWGPAAVLAVGLVNLVCAAVALVADVEGAVVGVVISAAIVVAMVPFVAARHQKSSAVAASR